MEFWGFAIFPNVGSKFNAIAESPSVRTVAAFQRPGNAHKFSLDISAGA